MIIAFPEPTVCWPWHLKFCGPSDRNHGRPCFVCGKEVATPRICQRPICLYCGMDRGIVPLVEVAPWEPDFDREVSPWLAPV